MKKNTLLILLVFILSSCSTNYYFVNIDEDAIIHTTKNATDTIAIIPKGYGAYINASTEKYRKVKWKNYKGWVINPSYSNANTSSNNYNLTKTTYQNTSSSSSGGSVYVKGYTRKDGTYVRPHTRSTARRR